ncbi:MAG: prolyl-tRNA synthetase associated domain-containing protein [Acutalibacteraceae bacterium]
MEYKISNGAPENYSERAEKEKAVYSLLTSLGIEYLQIDHPAADTIADCENINKVLGIEICKNLFLCNRQRTDFYLLMLPGSKPFKTKELSHSLGISRLSFADAEFMERYLNILPGSVSVMGLMNDTQNRVRLLIDSDLLKDEYIGCHPCVNTSTLKIKTSDITDKFLPAVKHAYTAVTLSEKE